MPRCQNSISLPPSTHIPDPLHSRKLVRQAPSISLCSWSLSPNNRGRLKSLPNLLMCKNQQSSPLSTQPTLEHRTDCVKWQLLSGRTHDSLPRKGGRKHHSVVEKVASLKKKKKIKSNHIAIQIRSVQHPEYVLNLNICCHLLSLSPTTCLWEGRSFPPPGLFASVSEWCFR